MRQQLCKALAVRAKNPDMVFLTGDLGFMALEELRPIMGPRFINAGIAEQNMVSIGAALSRQSFDVWIYSIAPFCYARPFEQIRNDITFHKLPVKLIGNGGGFGYGVMGPTHHAIEDYGVLLTLQGMRVFAPIFANDVEASVSLAASYCGPSYLRLGRSEAPQGYSAPPYSAWRQLVHGQRGVVITIGSLAGSYIAPLLALPESSRPSLWAVSELPIATNPPPDKLISLLRESDFLVVAEEHVSQGGLAASISLFFAASGNPIPPLRHLYARAHTFDRYGSQEFLREKAGLDPKSLLALLEAA